MLVDQWSTSPDAFSGRLLDYLNSAPGALWGFLGPATGSVANLIAGTPGLAGTGWSWAPSVMAQQQFNASQAGPTRLDRLGAYAGIAAGVGNLFGGGAKLFDPRGS